MSAAHINVLHGTPTGMHYAHLTAARASRADRTSAALHIDRSYILPEQYSCLAVDTFSLRYKYAYLRGHAPQTRVAWRGRHVARVARA